MPQYHMTWTNVKQDDKLTLLVAPDPGVSVTGNLRVQTPGNPVDEVRELTAADLVPKWSRKILDGQIIHMTLMYAFPTSTVASVTVSGQCRHPNGDIHQHDFHETYSGSKMATVFSFVWVN